MALPLRSYEHLNGLYADIFRHIKPKGRLAVEIMPLLVILILPLCANVIGLGFCYTKMLTVEIFEYQAWIPAEFLLIPL